MQAKEVDVDANEVIDDLVNTIGQLHRSMAILKIQLAQAQSKIDDWAQRQVPEKMAQVPPKSVNPSSELLR